MVAFTEFFEPISCVAVKMQQRAQGVRDSESEILGEADAPTASPPHPSTAAARSAGPPSIWQLCAYGPNLYFSKWYSHPDSAPQAAAIEPGYFGAAAAPAPVAWPRGA